MQSNDGIASDDWIEIFQLGSIFICGQPRATGLFFLERNIAVSVPLNSIHHHYTGMSEEDSLEDTSKPVLKDVPLRNIFKRKT